MNKVFQALNDETRRQIIDLLKVEDMTAGEIAEHFDISKPSISHHLDKLKQADLVTAVRDGQFISYSLNTTVLDDILNWFISLSKST